MRFLRLGVQVWPLLCGGVYQLKTSTLTQLAVGKHGSAYLGLTSLYLTAKKSECCTGRKQKLFLKLAYVLCVQKNDWLGCGLNL